MPDPKHELRIIKDASGQKLADKLFELYEGDRANRAAFHIALDRLLSEMSCKPVATDKEDDVAEEDYDDDEDLHGESPADEETASIDEVKDALRRVISRSIK